jgi:hypothetical protein
MHLITVLLMASLGMSSSERPLVVNSTTPHYVIEKSKVSGVEDLFELEGQESWMFVKRGENEVWYEIGQGEWGYDFDLVKKTLELEVSEVSFYRLHFEKLFKVSDVFSLLELFYRTGCGDYNLVTSSGIYNFRFDKGVFDKSKERELGKGLSIVWKLSKANVEPEALAGECSNGAMKVEFYRR